MYLENILRCYIFRKFIVRIVYINIFLKNALFYSYIKTKNHKIVQLSQNTFTVRA